MTQRIKITIKDPVKRTPEALAWTKYIEALVGTSSIYPSASDMTTADIPVDDLLQWSDSCAPLPKWYRRRPPCEPS